ncbi:hypothetical protein [Bifidobacterium tissieri]|uniref:Uncharacterized protein n=1 Tax=Bifidobacterium tissieri TaxID=1630162 RepID=A0A5M9ZM16_9BIFI|nr:hypothetical protein [Bifidobacterium tissieri]KAA8828686.1 hypothetical protein EM849_11655 [Bifidobacterium tissieri]KAA8831629.1 hypothetical protein EMO89_02570 [Bifidobacterium tissieri]
MTNTETIDLFQLTKQSSGVMIEPEPYLDGDALIVTNWETGYDNYTDAQDEGIVNILDYLGNLSDYQEVIDDNNDLPGIGKDDKARCWTVRDKEDREFTVLAPLGWI